MSGELGAAHWTGREIQQRDYYYFYKGLNESLEQERAQLRQLQEVTSSPLLKFGIGTKFGGTMGRVWEMKPVHLIELALDVDRIEKIMALTVKDANGEPHPTDKDGMALVLPKLKRLYIKFSVMAYRAYNEPTIRKWLDAPEQKAKDDKVGILAKILGSSDAEE
jgi:hypothetical protein